MVPSLAPLISLTTSPFLRPSIVARLPLLIPETRKPWVSPSLVTGNIRAWVISWVGLAISFSTKARSTVQEFSFAQLIACSAPSMATAAPGLLAGWAAGLLAGLGWGPG